MSNQKSFEWCNQILKTPTYIKELKDFELETLAQYVHKNLISIKNDCIKIASSSVDEKRSFEEILNMLLTGHNWYNNYLSLKATVNKEIIHRDYLGYEVEVDMSKMQTSARGSKKRKFILLHQLGILDFLKDRNLETKGFQYESRKEFYTLIAYILGYDDLESTSKTLSACDIHQGTDSNDMKNEKKIIEELEKDLYKIGFNLDSYITKNQ